MAWWSTPGWVVYAPSTADMGTILKTIGSRLCGVVIFEHSVKGAIRMLVELSSSKSLTCLISVHVLRCEESEMEGRASNHVMDMIINCRLEVVPPPDLPFEKMDERKVLVVAKVPLLRELLLRMGLVEDVGHRASEVPVIDVGHGASSMQNGFRAEGGQPVDRLWAVVDAI